MKDYIDSLTTIIDYFINLRDTAGELIELIETQKEKKNFTAKVGRVVLRNTGMGTDRTKFKDLIKSEKSKIESIDQKCKERIRKIFNKIQKSLTKKSDITKLEAQVNREMSRYYKLRDELYRLGKYFFDKCRGEKKCNDLLQQNDSLITKLNIEEKPSLDGMFFSGGSKRNTLRKK
jgi:predicted RNase H-like nuclease (RuvC/YqgF family)